MNNIQLRAVVHLKSITVEREVIFVIKLFIPNYLSLSGSKQCRCNLETILFIYSESSIIDNGRANKWHCNTKYTPDEISTTPLFKHVVAG